MKNNSDQNFQLFLQNRKYLVITVILVWLSFGLGFFVIRSQVKSSLKRYTELNKKRAHLKKLEQKLTELKQIRLSKEFKEKDKVDEVLPSHKPLLELLANLNMAAKKNEISFTNFEISPGKVASPGAKVEPEMQPTNKDYQSLELELSISGKEPDVEKFLEIVERIAPLTTITELSIGSQQYEENSNKAEDDDSSEGSTISNAEMIMSSYYYTQSVNVTLSKKLPSVGEKEIEVFNSIQKFRPSNFEPQTELKQSELEDIFGVENLVGS